MKERQPHEVFYRETVMKTFMQNRVPSVVVVGLRKHTSNCCVTGYVIKLRTLFIAVCDLLVVNTYCLLLISFYVLLI